LGSVGPTLSEFGVTGVLTDPKLEIYSDTTKIAENDNWSVSLASTAASVGAFALTAGSKDASITVSLPKGGYTVQVSGADGGVGDALVEIYELP
jgi:NADPH-dependent curcumin reductase CurA